MSKLVCVAKIQNAHGIKGHVKIKPYTENIEDFLNFKNILDANENIIKIKKTGISKDLIIAKIENIDTRNQSEILAGTELYVLRSDFPESKDEEFYHSDLIDIDVLNVDLEKIGTVKAIHNFGAGDIIEIAFTNVINNNMFLFNKENFPEVNLTKSYIILSSID